MSRLEHFSPGEAKGDRSRLAPVGPTPERNGASEGRQNSPAGDRQSWVPDPAAPPELCVSIMVEPRADALGYRLLPLRGSGRCANGRALRMVRLASLLVCLFLIWVGATRSLAQSRNDDAERILAHAIELHQAGDIEGAIREYQAFLALRPNMVEARSNLGAALARLGRYQEAIEQYQKALAVDGKNAAVRFNLGVALYKAAKIPEAAAELSRVVAAQPDNLNAHLLLGDCHLRMGEFKKVIDLMTPLEAKQPDNRAVAYLLGTALLRDNQIERGQLVIDRLLRDGESAEAHLLLGTARLMARDYAEAIKDLARAVELNPKLPSAHAYYGRALLETGNPAEALEAFRQELEINPNDFESNLYIGVLLRQERKNDEALSHLERALAVRPGALDVRYQIGALLLATGKVAEAQRVLEEVVKEAPNFVEAHVSLATAYYRLKRKEDGDRHRAIVQKLNDEAQARQPGAQGDARPASRGEPAPGASPQAGQKPSTAQP